MAPRLRSAGASFDALPEPVFRVLFLALPVDERARAACVCRSWRAFLADPSLWQVLDLSPAGGVAAARVTENLVRGAVARAAGQLRTLSINDDPDWLHIAFLVELIESNGAELQQVNAGVWLSTAQLRNVFAAAPRLQVLNGRVMDQCTALLPVLRKEPPYAPVRVDELVVCLQDTEGAEVLALAAAVAAHEPLECLRLKNGRLAGGVNALVDAAATRLVSVLELDDCATNAESIQALVRLLQRGSLTKLVVKCDEFPVAPEATLLELCAALRICRTLTHLKFWLNPVNGLSHRVVTELLDAAAELPALFLLDLSYSYLLDRAAAGRAFGALLRADLPSLRILLVFNCPFGDEGLAPLLDGLAANTHLRALFCGENETSEAFERDRLEPALAALAARAEHDA
jgi:hypothetical protein